jgi:hypothetical protein
MKLEEIRNVAKQLGLKPGKLAKANLIKAIQIAEGNIDCYATASSGECDQLNCLWREDCLPASVTK